MSCVNRLPSLHLDQSKEIMALGFMMAGVLHTALAPPHILGYIGIVALKLSVMDATERGRFLGGLPVFEIGQNLC